MPIPVGMEFEDSLKLLLEFASWDHAVVEVLRFHEEKHPEVILYFDKDVQRRVQRNGLDDDTDRKVLHAVIETDAGFLVLNTSVGLQEFYYS